MICDFYDLMTDGIVVLLKGNGICVPNRVYNSYKL